MSNNIAQAHNNMHMECQNPWRTSSRYIYYIYGLYVYIGVSFVVVPNQQRYGFSYIY